MKIDSNVPAVGLIRAMPKQPDPESSPTASARESVSISKEAMALSAQEKDDESNALAKYERIYGRQNFGEKLWVQIRAQGRDTQVMTGFPEDYSSAQLTQINNSFEFLLAVSERGKITDNPFTGLSRADLVGIVEDETGRYTDVERYAAVYAKNAVDLDYFRAAMDFGNDARPLYRAYIDFLDSLSPAERLKYPAGDREMSERLLAQDEQKNGKLPSEFSLWELMEQERRRLENDTSVSVESRASHPD